MTIGSTTLDQPPREAAMIDNEPPANEEIVLLTLRLTPDVNALLEDLARRTGGTKADVFRMGVGLLKLSLDAIRDGKRVGAVRSDQDIDTEFVGF